MQLARFPSSLRLTCTLAFLAVCFAPGFGVKADSTGTAKLLGTQGIARVRSLQAEVPRDSVRLPNAHLPRPSLNKQAGPAGPEPRTHAHIVAASADQPLSFEPNQGQTDRQVEFLSRGRGYTLFFTRDETVLALRKRSAVSTEPDQRSDERNAKYEARNSNAESRTPMLLRMSLVGASLAAEARGMDELPSKSNYFLGNDPQKWRTNVPHYARLRYEHVYPGIDLVYYGNQGYLEYDFVVAPGADPRAIRLVIEPPQSSVSSSQLSVGQDGDLVIASEEGEVRFHKPFVYQPESTVDSQQSPVTHGQKIFNQQSAIP